ncbi:hypothetical protein [Pseudoalteromonas sp. MMG024]|uniref:hypothetical protein n=1 Tax=Pseudoalteromonas sp. MMG024 TaxID=2909980 RepID=UPI001F278AFE|nr:hypothetical protein [Pseudoalteromonas sp. MMG024]MCF6457620.1 hypothetical protein [Pseudoalteromonas sp. MMG024]
MTFGFKNTLLNIIKTQPVVDQHSEAWILDTFLWVYQEFDGDVLLNDMRFVLPNAEFFPEQVSSIEQMASYVFTQVKQYAGMQAWPIQLVAPHQISEQSFPYLEFANVKRGESAELTAASGSLNISFNPNQINQPQDLIASFSQSLAHINVLQNRSLPPGGQEFVPQAVDLLSCFMGFGVMMANTAYQFRGGCGSCYNPYANRSATLNESELIYILALLLKAKNLPLSHISAHLKPHLRAMLKRANKQLENTIKQSANPMLIALTEVK